MLLLKKAYSTEIIQPSHIANQSSAQILFPAYTLYFLEREINTRVSPLKQRLEGTDKSR